MDAVRFLPPSLSAAFVVFLLLSSGCLGDYNPDRDIVVAAVSGDGETGWTETLDYGFDDYAGDIAVTKDGGCIVAGQSAADHYGDYTPRLIRFSPGGEVLWDKTLPRPGGAPYSDHYSVVQTGDGGFAVLTGDGQIFRTGPDGGLLWTAATGLTGASSLIETSNGGFAAAGVQEDRIPFGSIPVYDENGNVTSRDPLPGEAVVTPGCHETVIGTGENAVTVTECTGPVKRIGQAAVAKTDGDGNVIWRKAYGAENISSAWTLAESPGGENILVAGYETIGDGRGNNTNYAAALLLDENGTAAGSVRIDEIEYYVKPVVSVSPGGYDIMYVNTTLAGGRNINRLAEAHLDTGKEEITSLRVIANGTVFARTTSGNYLIADTAPGKGGSYRERTIVVSLYDSGGDLLWERDVDSAVAASVEKVVPVPVPGGAGEGCMLLALKENSGLL